MFCKASLVSSLAVVCGLAQATTRVGDATWFNPGLGACGVTNSDSDFIVAISASLFDSFCSGCNSNNNSVCGRSITATTADGSSVTVTIADRCVGCASNDIDLSPTAFSKLAPLSVGRLPGVSWNL